MKETMVVTALERPNFYAETYNNQGDTMVKSNFNLQGASVNRWAPVYSNNDTVTQQHGACLWGGCGTSVSSLSIDKYKLNS
jgi:hypothetical protein